MKLAKTTASTSRAPRAPSRVSVRVLVPWPPLVPASSWARPVTPVCQPAGAAAARARPMGPDGSGALEPCPGGRNTRAKLTEPPPPEKRASPVVAWCARRDRRGQHDRRILEAAGVVAALDGGVGLEGLAGDAEAGRQGAGGLADGGEPGSGDRQPGQHDNKLVPQDHAGQPDHRTAPAGASQARGTGPATGLARTSI